MMRKRSLCVLILLALLLSACGNSRPKTKEVAAETEATQPIATDMAWIVSNGTLTIQGHGAIPDYSYDNESPWAVERDRITRVVISEGITRIGNNAFYRCENLTSVVIPDTVTTIGDHAFRYCEMLGGVNLPTGVTSIGSYAFGSCKFLISIAIYQNVTHIGTAAFHDCEELKEISVVSTNRYYSSENGILFNKDKTALIRCPAGNRIKSYYIPSTVTVLEDGAFESCTRLQSIMIPDSVTTIGNFVFDGCFDLLSIFIPESVTSMGWDVFNGCYDLEEITVAVGNPNYASADGVLLSKDRQTLLLYPDGKEIPEPLVLEGIAKIGGRAFEFNRALRTLTVAEGVTEIDAYAFWNCTNLWSVSLPSTLTSIGNAAFDDCSSINNITFNGTKAQWESISKTDFTDCTFTVHCTDGSFQYN